MSESNCEREDYGNFFDLETSTFYQIGNNNYIEKKTDAPTMSNDDTTTSTRLSYKNEDDDENEECGESRNIALFILLLGIVCMYFVFII
jgi:hypothetical protein